MNNDAGNNDARNDMMTSYYDSKVHLSGRKPSFTSTKNLMEKVQSHDTMNVKHSL